jgi:RimJ/RimL family protein N-acetyltransferase
VLIETGRLRIRDWTPRDAPAALDIQGRVEVMQWLGDGPPLLARDLDDARERIERWRGREDPPLGFWAIEVSDGGPLHGRVIGSVLLVPLPNGDGAVEIGWHLHPIPGDTATPPRRRPRCSAGGSRAGWTRSTRSPT